MRRSEDETVLQGYWDIPGGSLHGEESPLDCVIREAKEEAGLEIEAPDLAFHTSNIDESKGERFVRLIFIIGPTNGEVSLSEEHDKFEWVDPAKAPKKLKLVDYLNDFFKVISLESHQLSRLTQN
jgi:8-oxo-dGTP pyrophosphatase MutT (NUDIX family)